MAMQMMVVKNAIFKERHSTLGKMESEKKRVKLEMVNWKVRTSFPLTVKAYRTIMTMGSMIMMKAQIM